MLDINFVQCSCVGKMGRFGNAMFQYIFAKTYAEKHDALLFSPHWVGEQIFDLPAANESIAWLPTQPEDFIPNKTKVNLNGYFQKEQHINTWINTDYKSIFPIRQNILDAFVKPEFEYIAVHLRRGDYTYLPNFPTLSFSLYEKEIRKRNITLPILIITDDQPHSNSYYDSIGLPWLQDFMLLNNAKIVMPGNSTFSWWAAALSNSQIISPDLDGKNVVFKDGLNLRNIQCW